MNWSRHGAVVGAHGARVRSATNRSTTRCDPLTTSVPPPCGFHVAEEREDLHAEERRRGARVRIVDVPQLAREPPRSVCVGERDHDLPPARRRHPVPTPRSASIASRTVDPPIASKAGCFLLVVMPHGLSTVPRAPVVLDHAVPTLELTPHDAPHLPRVVVAEGVTKSNEPALLELRALLSREHGESVQCRAARLQPVNRSRGAP